MTDSLRTLEAHARQKRQEAAHANKVVRDARKAERPARVFQQRAEPVAKGQRDPRAKSPAFLQWLRRQLCIACEIEQRRGFKVIDTGPIQAAHQKLAIASRGWREGGLGPRVSDDRCVALCEWHHLLAPDACDKGQRAFWRRLFGDEAVVADLCAATVADCNAGRDGAATIRQFAARKP